MTKNRTMTALSVLAIAASALAAPAAFAADKDSGWMIRARAVGVVPDEGGSTSIGGKPQIDNSVVPEIDISYFFNESTAVELILATTPHDAQVKGSALGNVDLGDVWLLPPTLLLQHHFVSDSKFKPYVGAGVNYTFFYGEDTPNSGPVTQIDYDDGFGFALQAGVDYHYKDNWYLNLDVKHIWLDTDVLVNNGGVTAKVDIDPWLIGLGVGYRY
ncbi:MAG: OmpW family outer membrane protein [Alphaproteobacteria bacterium]